jgi:hypothetical protein
MPETAQTSILEVAMLPIDSTRMRFSISKSFFKIS